MSHRWWRITWRPGLVLNAVVLWNTRYTDAALAQLRVQGNPADDADAARLPPLGDHHLNVDGRYTLIPPSPAHAQAKSRPSAF